MIGRSKLLAISGKSGSRCRSVCRSNSCLFSRHTDERERERERERGREGILGRNYIPPSRNCGLCTARDVTPFGSTDVLPLVVPCSARCNRRKLERVLYRRYYDSDLSRCNESGMHSWGNATSNVPRAIASFAAISRRKSGKGGRLVGRTVKPHEGW